MGGEDVRFKWNMYIDVYQPAQVSSLDDIECVSDEGQSSRIV